MATKKSDLSRLRASNGPYVSNYPPLRDWLDKMQARCMWQVPREREPQDADGGWYPSAYIECWFVNNRPVIIVINANRMGWEIYTALNTNKVAETLSDAEYRTLWEPK